MDMCATPRAADDATARESRVAKLLAVDISSERVPPTRVVLRNVSPHGIGARGDLPLLPCERVTVHLPGDRTVAGTVRWVRKGTFGLSLDERVEPALLQAGATINHALVPRDAELGFQRLRHSDATAPRSGFQRSHRDAVLDSSGWNRD